MAHQTLKARKQEAAQALVEKARARFKELGEFYDVYSVDGEVRIDINWGDWKHDHGWVDHQMRVLGATKTDEIVTEEDGSDTYSSIHFYAPAA